MSNDKPNTRGPQSVEGAAQIPIIKGPNVPSLQIKTDVQDVPQISITLESINAILFNYLRDTIIPTIKDNGQDLPVPIEPGLPERWNTIKKLGVLRESATDKLLTPLIMMRRIGVKQGKLMNPVNKYVYQVVTKEWNSRNSYDRFTTLNGITPSRQLHNVIIPDYMDLSYKIVMWTELQSQMDQLIEQINVENYEFWGAENNYKFQITINEFQGTSELPPLEDRIIRTEFDMMVHAYIIPERMIKNFKLASTNQDSFTFKKIVFTESVVTDLKKLR